MDKQEIKKAQKRTLVVAAVLVALTSATFLPVASVIQVVLNCIAIVVCLIYMVYFLATYCVKAARKGDYSYFILPFMLFVFMLNTISFLPLPEDIVAILRLCAALIAIIGSIVFIIFSVRR